MVHVLQFLPRAFIFTVTPAMEAGISDHVWSIEEMCSLVPENHRIAVQTDKALIQKALAL